MDIVRDVAATDLHAKIESNNFVPTAAGLASSVSAYAALALLVMKHFNWFIKQGFI